MAGVMPAAGAAAGVCWCEWCIVVAGAGCAAAWSSCDSVSVASTSSAL
jgi:hypothetical protein